MCIILLKSAENEYFLVVPLQLMTGIDRERNRERETERESIESSKSLHGKCARVPVLRVVVDRPCAEEEGAAQARCGNMYAIFS